MSPQPQACYLTRIPLNNRSANENEWQFLRWKWVKPITHGWVSRSGEWLGSGIKRRPEWGLTSIARASDFGHKVQAHPEKCDSKESNCQELRFSIGWVLLPRRTCTSKTSSIIRWPQEPQPSRRCSPWLSGTSCLHQYLLVARSYSFSRARVLLYGQDELSVLGKGLIALNHDVAGSNPLAFVSRQWDERAKRDSVYSRKVLMRKMDLFILVGLVVGPLLHRRHTCWIECRP